MKKLLLLLLLIPNIILGQCAGNQSFTLTPAPLNGTTYQPGTVVTMCYTMDGWDTGFGANWLEGFDVNLGPGWVSYTPISAPDDCGGAALPQQWYWMESATNNTGTLTVGPGYFYEGPTGPIDGNPGNDWGDFGTNCLWTFCVQLQVSDECNPLSLLIEVTPYADGTMGSWGNESCFDGPFQVFNGTIAGGTVTTTPISISNDTTCYFQTLNYSVNYTPGSVYDWQVSGGGLLSSQFNNAQVYWGDVPGDYTISVQETTADGCVGPVMDTVITVVEPMAVLGVPYTACPGTKIELFSIPANGVWSGYNIENGTFQSDTAGFFFAHFTTNIYGCNVTDSVSITVNQPPVEQTILGGNDLYFCVDNVNQTYVMPNDPGVVYTWHVDGTLQNDDDFELQLTWPDSSMSHYIIVYGTDSMGCKGEQSAVTIATEACHRLYVPNSFTPNGDGYNDALKVYGLSVYDLDFKIYNRYGQIIHTLKSVNQVWNGNDGTGYFVETGVYNWIATYKDDKGFGHGAKGHIVLIR